MRRLVQLCAILAICTFPTFAQTQHDRIKSRGASTFDQISNTQTMVISGATPSIAGGNVFRTSNSGATTITNFLGGVDSQQITIICGDTNTTIQNNANIFITGGTNFSCTLNASLTFVFTSAASIWSETGGTGAGGGGSPGAPAQAFQCNNGSGGFVACAVTDDTININVNENTRFKGPNPYVDVTAFGARAANPNTTPATVGLTANCTNTLNTVTISSASTFVNGDGVVLYGCGAPHSMTTPVISSVTYSLDLAGTATLHSTPGPTGATTYNYKMIARDRNGGLTAASAVVSTTTGAASLGTGQIVNITSMSRSTRTVTVTTAAAHGFPVGCGVATCGEVFIGGGNALSDATFRGWYTVTSATDTTHFTFVSGPDTTLGATTSATGGTATWFSHNNVCTASMPTGAVQLYLLSDRANPGTYSVVAAGYPNFGGGDTTDLCIQDYGSPMMDNQAFPPFVTAAAPWSVATSDHLSTTIVSGAGTTSLTLANAAGTSVTGATIRLDATPGIVAAAAFAATNGGTVLFPKSTQPFVINSWLNVNTTVPFAQVGDIYLNDTFEMTSSGTTRGATYQGNIMPQVGGGSPPGSWGSYSAVSVNTAHPGFWFSHSQQFGLHVSGLNISGVPVNGSVLMVAEGGFNQTFDRINFVSGSGVNDYISMGLMLKGSAGQENSNVIVDYVGFAPGGVGDGVSHTPTFWCRNCGAVSIPRSFSVHRGMLIDSAGTFTPISVAAGGVSYINGGGTPLFTLFGPASATIGGPIALDTIAHPCFAVLSTGPNSATITSNPGGLCSPSSAVLPISGNYGTLINASTDPTFYNSTGILSANIGGASGYIASQKFNAYLNIDPNHSAFIRSAPPATPTCTVSAGGSVPVGTYQFMIATLWQNNGEGSISPTSTACTTTTGNQTITANYSGVSGNPKGLDLYYCISNGTACTGGFAASNTFNNPQSPSSTSLVWSSSAFNSAVYSGVQTGGPTMLIGGTQGIASPNVVSPQYQLSNSGFTSTETGTLTANRTVTLPDITGFKIITPELFTNSPRGPLHVLFPGALTTTWTGETWTLDKAITVTRVQAQAKTAPSGCSTNAIIRLTDGTTPINLTVSAAANDSGAVSQNYAAGAVLTLSVQTAASGCATSPGDANAVVQYKMQ